MGLGHMGHATGSKAPKGVLFEQISASSVKRIDMDPRQTILRQTIVLEQNNLPEIT